MSPDMLTIIVLAVSPVFRSLSSALSEYCGRTLWEITTSEWRHTPARSERALAQAQALARRSKDISQEQSSVLPLLRFRSIKVSKGEDE